MFTWGTQVENFPNLAVFGIVRHSNALTQFGKWNSAPDLKNVLGLIKTEINSHVKL